MRHGCRFGLVGVMGLIGWLALASSAAAVEYRLRVVSIPDSAHSSFLRPGESQTGASGPSLNRLEASLDRGDFPQGAVLFDRRVQPVRESLGRAYGGARIVPDVKLGGAGPIVWDEMIWEGKPGEQSVWILLPIIRNFQEVYNVALRGTGPLRNYQPYTVPMDGSKVAAVLIALNFLWIQEERGIVWDEYISRSLDLADGIGAVIGVNVYPLFPDQVYLITKHTAEPTAYEVVVVWRERKKDRETPGPGVIIR
jgi:hypothetical protein